MATNSQASADREDALFGSLFRWGPLQRLVAVRSDSPERARRGGILITICSLAIVLTFALILNLALSGGKAIGFGLLMSANVFYALAIVVAKSGRTNAAGMMVAVAISVISVLFSLMQETLNSGLIYVLVGILTASYVLRPALIWVVIALNLALLVAVDQTSHATLLALPDPMQNYLIDLGTLVLGAGIIGWINALFTTRLFTHVQQTREALERSTREEREALVAREVAEQASEAKSWFLASMSHELRTPLNAIIGYAEIIGDDIEEDAVDPDALREDVTRINDSGRHLLRIIDEILDLSRVEAGRMALTPETFEVGAMIRGLVEVFAPMVTKQGNTLEVEIDDGVGTMHTDRARLEQVLQNLVSNATKFTTSGTITLRAARRGARVRFEVEDTGIGMEPEVLSQIFEVFTQADSSTTRRFDGAGLGLTIVERLTTLLQGEVSVTSTPHVGSSFAVDLPATLSEPGDAPRPTP